MKSNLFAAIPARLDEELIEILARGGRCTLERIVSRGHSTPPGDWYDQERDEWVVLLRGAAQLRFADEEEPVPLAPGDHILIAAHRRHRVESTAAGEDTVWLALHFENDSGPGSD